ncbi:MAG: hypothetical protein FWE30_07360 [Bacteroidales bacterium]|nr:hypothetical protein [Bacteroidales bacterium]
MRVVVSSLGMISGLGCSVPEALDALLRERSALTPLRYVNSKHSRLPMGEVPLSDWQLKAELGIDSRAVITRSALLGIMAVKECLSGLPEQVGRTGLVSGNTVGGMEKSEVYYREFLDPTQHEHTPYIDAHDCGACTEGIADYFGCFDFISSISTACSSAANAVAMGARLIRTGRLDRVVVGGTECLSKFHINGFLSLTILSDSPCAPFDAHRKGINLGEGAAYLMLESQEALEQRGGKALAVVSGYGNACDAYPQTASSPEGKAPF